MAEVSLFRKWRSRTFADLVGQESVVRTLRNVLAGGSPARAYLFCGPRGTGKTSSARIFAKALCCEQRVGLEPCDRCSTCKEIALGSCLDVFEIDAASHTQVEKIRDFIVDKVHFAPARAPYKVYIIDEVHKLSGASFNALLKTLEEPPAHVVFILATTHPHEVLPTILSRCQRYDFRPLSVAEIRARLAEVAVAEGKELEADAAALLARAADGSLRDALVLLEQALCFCGSRVGASELEQLLGLVPHVTLESFVEHVLAQDTRGLLALLHEQTQAGHDLARFANSALEHLRGLMLVRSGAPDSSLDSLPELARESLARQAEKVSLAQLMIWLKALLELTQAIRDGGPPRLLWEMAAVQLTFTTPAASASGAAVPGLEALVVRVERLERTLTGPETTPRATGARMAPAAPENQTPPSPESVAPAVHTSPSTPVEEVRARASAPRVEPEPSLPPKKTTPPKPVEATRPAASQDRPSPLSAKEFWLQFLNATSNKKIQAILKEARLEKLDASTVELSLPESLTWHFNEINKVRPELETQCEQLLGRPVSLVCQLQAGRTLASDVDEHTALVQKAGTLFVGKIIEE